MRFSTLSYTIANDLELVVHEERADYSTVEVAVFTFGPYSDPVAFAALARRLADEEQAWDLACERREWDV